MAPTVATVGANTATTATMAPAVIGHSATTRPDSSYQPSDNGGNVNGYRLTSMAIRAAPARHHDLDGTEAATRLGVQQGGFFESSRRRRRGR